MHVYVRGEAVWLGYWRKQTFQAGLERDLLVRAGGWSRDQLQKRLGVYGHLQKGSIMTYVCGLCWSAFILVSQRGEQDQDAGAACVLPSAVFSAYVDLCGWLWIYVHVRAHTPHSQMDVGLWCCSSFTSVRLPHSATSSINQSYIFSNSIPYIFKQHYGFSVGRGLLGGLDENLTLISLQMNDWDVLHSLLVTLNKTRSQNYFLPK